MATRTTNYNLYKPDATDDFSDFREEFNDNMNIIDENLGGGGGSGGHTIYDKDGTALAQENGLQFKGAVSVSDDSVNGRTVVEIEGGGNYYLNTIFSTEEKKIGYWTDGKPLYQKTINCGTLPNSSNKNISTPNNLENLIDAFGFAYSLSDPKYQRLVPFSAGGTNDIRVDLSNSIITITTFSNWSGYSAYLTIQYTKTTDTADPNPQFGNVIYLPTIYSEEERQVGVWKDGKPLYQKTFIQTLNNIASGTEANMADVSGLNIDELADITGRVNYYNGANWFDVNLGTYFGAYVHTDGYLTFLQTMTGQTTNRSYKVAVTLRYTKTTDTAGSGEWVPSGAPAVHYSTNEQVIGTWIDGKPLYEKTINFGALPNSSTKEVDHNISDLKMAVGFEGMMMNTDGVTFETLPSGENSNFRIQINATKIKIITSASWAAWTNSYITLKYTKTTD